MPNIVGLLALLMLAMIVVVIVSICSRSQGVANEHAVVSRVLQLLDREPLVIVVMPGNRAPSFVTVAMPVLASCWHSLA